LFVLGHSLGGTAAPRVAAADPELAGLVMLAGGAQPLHWATVRQVRYLQSPSPTTWTGGAPPSPAART
jgi:pimeloyl-ACP methyl ester carboxylesterase